MTEIISVWAERLLGEAYGMSLRLHPVYLLAFVVIAGLVYVVRHDKDRQAGGFLSWLFPRHIWAHPSTRVDVQLFVAGRLLMLTGLFNTVVIRTFSAALIMLFAQKAFGLAGRAADSSMSHVLLVTLIMTMTADFCVYWVHRLHHQSRGLWPFHAVHHSAEVLSPVTVYRKHPLYDLIAGIVKALLVGAMQAFMLLALVGKVEIALVGGINAFGFLFNLLGANFRHSHIWISYGRALEHIFISPAQHQIHHSLNPAHHDKNFGEIFALWDWMFGTLYVPERQEQLEFGIARPDGSGTRIAQPHPTLRAALLRPFNESYKVWQKSRAARAKGGAEPLVPAVERRKRKAL